MKSVGASIVTLLCAGVLANASQARADFSIDPSVYSPDLYLHAKQSHPQHGLGTFLPAGKKEKPMARNEWGGIPCIINPDGTTQCFGQPAVPPPAKPGAPTDGEILTAIKKIGLPSLEINIQPNDETLVNFDTIFFARPQPFRRNVNLLDYDIDLVATPVGFTWHHGDGTSHTTSKPGAPYPSKGVTYRYQESARNLRPSVDVTYTVRYRVDGGAWQNLSQTLQASGPAGDLDVREATPVLAHY